MGTHRICIHNKTHIRTVLNSYTHITYRIPYYIILSAIYIQFFFYLRLYYTAFEFKIQIRNLPFRFHLKHTNDFRFFLQYIEMLSCLCWCRSTVYLRNLRVERLQNFGWQSNVGNNNIKNNRDEIRRDSSKRLRPTGQIKICIFFYLICFYK